MILIDGHNLLFRTSKAVEEDVVQMQEELIIRLRSSAESLGKSMILVFDGTGGAGDFGREFVSGPMLRVVFSGKTMSADDWIAAWLDENKGEQHTLVSDDRGLAQRVKRKGLSFAGTRSWLEKLEPGKNTAREKKEFGSVEYWMSEFGLKE